MKVTEQVYAVGGGHAGLGISNEYDCNVFLIDGGSELVLIDAGCGYDVEPILSNIRRAGFEPTRVRRLANLGVEALLPGHGGFCLGGGQRHLDEAIEAFKSIWPPRNYR